MNFWRRQDSLLKQSQFWLSKKLTRRRALKHPLPDHSSCETGPRRSRPTLCCDFQKLSPRGSPQSPVANLWTEFTAFDCQRMGADEKECKNPIKPWWLQLSKRQKLTFLPNL